MAKKKESLTQEEIDSLPAWRDMGIKIGLATGDGTVDETTVRDLTDKHRVLCGIKKAKYFAWAESPKQALDYLKPLGATSNNALYGNQDIHWLNFYSFWRCSGLTKETEKIVHLLELTKYVSWMWMSSNTTVVCALPTKVHTYMGKQSFTDYDGQAKEFDCPILHNENGKSIEFADGFGVYHLFGQAIPESESWIVTTPADKLDAKKILGITNTEIRTAAIKKVGIEKMFDGMDKTLLDERTYEVGGTYKLWEIDFGGKQPRKYLQMACPSKGEIHVEGVHPDCMTVHQANGWRDLGDVLAEETIFTSDFVYYEPKVQS